MCLYNGVRVSKEDYVKLKKLEKQLSENLLVRILQSGFDYTTYPVLKPNEDRSDFEIVKAHWEFIPPWVKSLREMELIRKGIDPKTGEKKAPIPWLNAKGETLLTSRMFRDAALKRRCLILSSGFCEYRHVGKKTIPHYISLKDQSYFFMAGIWQPWTDQETGETMDTFAMVTTAANPLMETIHNTKKRMPTILLEEEAFEWLFGNLSEARIRELATYQLDDSRMQYHTIRRDFLVQENPVERFQYSELTDLFS
jgi:putative SOS response-associated peptidase YedK